MFDLDPEYWWAIIGISLIIIEVFSPSFFAASLALGAFAAAIAGKANATLEWQLGIFSLISILSVFFVRPIAKKYLYDVVGVKTNADALVGKTGMMKEAITASNPLGRVAIDGDEWQCQSESGYEIAVGQKVIVTARESIILTVK